MQEFNNKVLSLEHLDSKKPVYTSVLRLKILKKGKYFVTVNQKDEKFFKNNQIFPYKYAGVRMLIGKDPELKGEGLKFINAGYNVSRNMTLEQTLEPGTYIVTIDMMWNSPYKKFTVCNPILRYCTYHTFNW